MKLFYAWFLFATGWASVTSVPVKDEITDSLLDICAAVICRPGRVCRILDNGVASCQCVQHCPSHHKPVCGTNGVTYDNHCLLHKDACLGQKHISIKHKGHCKKPKVKSPHHKYHQKPVVCFQHERDRIRRHFVELLQSEISHDRHYPRVVDDVFDDCDHDGDDFLSTHELSKCIRRNNTMFHTWLKHRSELAATLCVDAMVEVADRNSDWLLSRREFQNFMRPSYRPPIKSCPLEDRYYKDGDEIMIDCSNCVCAGGNWSCASFPCELKASKHKKGHHHKKNNNVSD
uniref:Follistatin-related protein 1 n=2 Tax=Amblyomma TaxID=6942 RepID=G3MPL7_AMBMU